MSTSVAPQSLRLLIVDDSPANAAALVSGLEASGWLVDSRRVDAAGPFAEALATTSPEVVVSAPAVPGFDAFAALSALAELRPGCPLIVAADTVDAHHAVAALRAGAEDVVLRSDRERLARAVQSAVEIRHRLNLLSPRQRQVLALVARGNTSPEIATRLNISVKTVETHRGELMKRIGARDVVGLVHYALRVGLVPNAA